ncbi:hypothetical protein EG328_003925 [Venturia inaequalis]|uniref:Fucose-specific lectin n=1 Tax=Venturia inaequalis TaxID=5025 RepID=A0A8H3UPE7_VENIN|nr:hypothetical protein EG328_003925 [Venturia inaequalis]KAE9992636.1 hypothetical protein EG327_008379 [Venturia inaequalis]
MSPETEAPPDSPQMVSPMTPANVPTKERKRSLGKLRDSGLIKYSLDYSETWTEDHGKEVVPVAEGKQVKPHDGLEHEPPVDAKYVALPHDEKEHIHTARGGGGGEVEAIGKRKRCGIALKWVVILATVIMLLAVGLGVGLALGLKKKGSTKIAPAYRGSGSGNQPFLTGIDYDDPFENNFSGINALTDLFYQRKDGLIRQATMLANGTWLGAAADDFPATDAKIGTPLAVTSFTVRKNQAMAQVRHLFYIDTGGILRERTYDNITRRWSSGTLDQLNVKPVLGSGLQVCNGNDFAGDRNDTSYRDGITLFYGYTDDSIQQLGWNIEDKSWVKEQTFVDVNGKGGIACHIRPDLSTVVATNKTDVIFFWRDSNTTKRGSATHPINVWQRAPLSIPGIYEGAAIDMRAYGFGQGRNRGGNNNSTTDSNATDSRSNNRSGRGANWTPPNRYILTQLSDLTIRAFNITGSAENMALAPIHYRTTEVPSVGIGSPPAKALPGTKLSFTMDRDAVELGSGGRNSTRRTWITWFQTDSGAIGEYIAGSDDLDRWGVSSVDIGD